MSRISEARKRATENWNNKNREHRSYLSARSSARSFVRNKATIEDLEELKQIISEREEQLKQ